jgi:transposase InsO family protein
LGYSLVAFLCSKDATSQHFQAMVTWAETFTGHSLTSVHSDQGEKFMAGKLQLFFKSRGITHQASVPHIPQQNSCAERFNRTLLRKAETLCQYACLPRSFWQDAVETTLHIYNQQPIHYHE